MKPGSVRQSVRGRLAGVSLLALLAACTATPLSSAPSTGLQTATSTATATPTAIATPAASLPADARIVDKVKLDDPAGPLWLAGSSDSIWAAESQRVVRVNLKTDAIRGKIPTHAVDFSEGATGFGAVWESNFGLNVVYRIDIAAMKVVATILVGDSPEGVAVTSSAVWVANHHAGTVSRIDPATNRVTATVKVGPTGDNGPLTIAATRADVWVFIPKLNGVVGIDAATNGVIATLPLNGPPASDGTEVWIAADNGMGQSSAVKIDPGSGKVLETVPVDDNPPAFQGIAIGLGSVWMTTSSGLFRIDQATAKVVGHLPCNPACTNWTAIAGGAVWLSAEGQPYILKVAPQ